MKALVLLWPCLLLAQQPPMSPISPYGRASPYITTVDVRVTNTVTTVYDVTFLRTIRIYGPITNGLPAVTRTNFLQLDTNVISCVTNTTPLIPE